MHMLVVNEIGKVAKIKNSNNNKKNANKHT